MADEEFPDTLIKTYAAFGDAMRAKDAAGMAAVYHSEATICPPGGKAASGSDGIRAIMQAGFIDIGVDQFEIDRKEATAVGDTGIERAEFKCKNVDGEVLFDGKYVVVWKKENGVWKNYIDIFNSNK